MASVTRTTGAHRDQRSAAARRIVDATDLLLRRGERFTEIPVERLLAEADVSRSTFYVHFADKSALLAQLAERALQEVHEAAEVWWQIDHAYGCEPAATTIRGMIKVYRRHAAVLRALTEVSTYDDAMNNVSRRRTDEYIALSAKRMAEEQLRGLIEPEVDVELGAATVIRLIDGAILDHIFHGAAHDDGRLAASLARTGWLARYGHIPHNGRRSQ